MKNLFNTVLLILTAFIIRAQNTIFISQPVSETEFNNIFGNEAMLTDQNKSILNLKVPEQIYETSYVEKGYSRDDLIKQLRFHKENRNYLKYFVLIGHNEDGKFFLPSGESMKLSEIEEYLHGEKAIFISCNSNNYINDNSIGLDFKIRYNEAFQIITKIEAHTSTCSRFLTSRSDMDNDVTKIIKTNKIKRDTEKTISLSAKAIGGGGTIYTVYEVIETLTEDEK